MVIERVVSIRDDHPSLAGHFPGYPIVPGAVLLREVLDTFRQSSGISRVVTGLPQVKFSAQLKPGEVATIRVEEETPTHATFSCRVQSRLIASGCIEFMPGTPLRAEPA